MGFVWEHADSFLHCVASPFHSLVTTQGLPESLFRPNVYRGPTFCTPTLGVSQDIEESFASSCAAVDSCQLKHACLQHSRCAAQCSVPHRRPALKQPSPDCSCINHKRVLRISAELGPPCNTNPPGSLIPTPPPPVPRRSKTLNQQVRITTLHCVRGIHLTCRTPLRRSTCACMPLLNYFDGAPLLEQFVIVECYECRPPCHTTPKHVRPCDS